MANDKNFELKVRRLAKRMGFYVTKSREKQQHSENHGEFMLVDSWTNTVVAGDRYDWPLQWIFDYLKEKPDVRC